MQLFILAVGKGRASPENTLTQGWLSRLPQGGSLIEVESKLPTIDLAKRIVDNYVKNTSREVSIDYIQKVVSEYFQMDVDTLQSKTRKRHIVQARQLAMFFAKKLTKASLASIGSQIGKRDHATVLHACKTVDNLSSTDKQFRKYVEDLNKKLTL